MHLSTGVISTFAVCLAKVAHALSDRVIHAWGVARLSRSQSRAAALATAVAVAAALAAVLMLRLSVPRDDDEGDGGD